jgi:glutathione synthase/RimK-type ligase-like ATP-grasp enzyme
MTKTVLIVSNTNDPHADAITVRLRERSLHFQRLNCDTFASSKQVWRIPSDHNQHIHSTWVHPDVSVVWYRKVNFPSGQNPVQEFIAQEHEGLFESVLDHYGHCRWVNSRSSIATARPKVAQLQHARSIGFRIPDSIITNDVAVLKEFADSHGGNVIAKPIRAQVVGNDKEALVVGTRQLLAEYYESATSYSPCYAQERLKLMSEIRVVAFGSNLYAFRLTADKEADDIKQLELENIQHEPCELDPSSAQKVRALMSYYKLEFAAIDFAVVDEEEPVFLELNPNGQWLWLQYVTGINLTDSFIDFLFF